jgi:hypothetical protein
MANPLLVTRLPRKVSHGRHLHRLGGRAPRGWDHTRRHGAGGRAAGPTRSSLFRGRTGQPVVAAVPPWEAAAGRPLTVCRAARRVLLGRLGGRSALGPYPVAGRSAAGYPGWVVAVTSAVAPATGLAVACAAWPRAGRRTVAPPWPSRGRPRGPTRDGVRLVRVPVRPPGQARGASDIARVAAFSPHPLRDRDRVPADGGDRLPGVAIRPRRAAGSGRRARRRPPAGDRVLGWTGVAVGASAAAELLLATRSPGTSTR